MIYIVLFYVMYFGVTLMVQGYGVSKTAVVIGFICLAAPGLGLSIHLDRQMAFERTTNTAPTEEDTKIIFNPGIIPGEDRKEGDKKK